MKKPLVINEDGQISVPNMLHSHLFTHAYRYLQPNGWFNDYPCDEEGIAPWMTYPSIQFLKDILSKENKVFEYGSGYSTVFFSKLVGEIVSVEHDKQWVDYIRELAPIATVYHADKNAEVHVEAKELVNQFIETFPQVRTESYEHDLKHGLINDEFAGYASKIYNYPKGYFDIIVLDGMARSLTGVIAVDKIAENGMIILDNSDRWHYNILQQYLNQKGFNRIDFWGPGFNNHDAWCTSIFAKNLPFKNHKIDRPITEGPITI